MTQTHEMLPQLVEQNYDPSFEELNVLEKETSDSYDSEYTTEDIDFIEKGIQQTESSESALNMLLKDILKCKRLTHEETLEIFKALDECDDENIRKDLQEKIVESNLLFCVKLAFKYGNRNIPLVEDLFQEGSMGLMKAIERFDYNKGFHFSTYAYWWIKQFITRYIDDCSRLIRLPVHVSEAEHKLTRISYQFSSINGRTPTVEELSKLINLSEKQVALILGISSTASLDEEVNADDSKSKSTLSDFVPDEYNLELDVEQKEISREVPKKIEQILDSRAAYIIRAKYGLSGCKRLSLEEIGEQLGITRERVRQLEAKAINKLKFHPNFRHLHEFVK